MTFKLAVEPFGKGQDIIKKILLAFGITTMALTATACNTVRGVGQDIESVGDAGDEVI